MTIIILIITFKCFSLVGLDIDLVEIVSIYQEHVSVIFESDA